jgi:hypothetical protein
MREKGKADARSERALSTDCRTGQRNIRVARSILTSEADAASFPHQFVRPCGKETLDLPPGVQAVY